MTPAVHAALRKLAAEPGNVWAFIIVVQKALPELLDDCERLEREVESYRVRCAGLGADYEQWKYNFQRRVLVLCEQADRDSATPQWIAEEVSKLDTED